MNAEEAYKHTILSENERYLNKFEMQEVLNLIKYYANEGRFKCNYCYDEKVKEGLISLGYVVSDMWKEDKWYRTEYMTISWDK